MITQAWPERSGECLSWLRGYRCEIAPQNEEEDYRDDGYRPIPGLRGLWINRRGDLWSTREKPKVKMSFYGYWRFTFNAKNQFIHICVLRAFRGPCPKGMEACHNDGDASNCHLSNLRWDTHINNMADRELHKQGQSREMVRLLCASWMDGCDEDQIMLAYFGLNRKRKAVSSLKTQFKAICGFVPNDMDVLGSGWLSSLRTPSNRWPLPCLGRVCNV